MQFLALSANLHSIANYSKKNGGVNWTRVRTLSIDVDKPKSVCRIDCRDRSDGNTCWLVLAGKPDTTFQKEEVIMEVLQYVSKAIGVIGILVICWGVLLGLIDFIRIEFDYLRGRNVRNRRYLLRHHLGSYLLAGLEFLIAADIVRTIVDPTLVELAILGAIIAIRTAISFFLNMEMKHPHYRTEGES